MFYHKIPGLKIDNANGLPTVQQTAEGAAMRGVPDWAAYVDPAYRSGNLVRNRARADGAAMQLASPVTPVMTTLAGRPAFNLDAQHLRIIANGALKPNAWTIFAVMNFGTTAGDPQIIAMSRTVVSSPDMSLRVGVSNSGHAVYVWSRGAFGSGQPIRQQRELAQSLAGRTALVMFTGGASGIHAYVNGQEVITAPEDTAPLSAGYAAGDWEFFRGCRGIVGEAGGLGIDLGARENTHFRKAIEQFLIARYSIT